MTDSASGPGRRAEGSLEPSSEEQAPSGPGDKERAAGGQELNDESGVGLGLGTPSTVEPEENAG